MGIMFALEYSKQNQKESAKELFYELYENTLKEEYLLEYLKLSFVLKQYDDIISKFQINEKQLIRYKKRIQKLYILSLIQEKSYDKAIESTKNLLETEKSDNNYGLLGTIYLQKGEYNKAKELFEKVYKNTSSVNTLVNLADVMYVYLDEKEEAINYLESYIKVYGCKHEICSKLLGYYQEEKNMDGIISILKKSYYNLKSNENSANLEKVYKLLMYY